MAWPQTRDARTRAAGVPWTKMKVYKSVNTFVALLILESRRALKKAPTVSEYMDKDGIHTHTHLQSWKLACSSSCKYIPRHACRCCINRSLLEGEEHILLSYVSVLCYTVQYYHGHQSHGSLNKAEERQGRFHHSSFVDKGVSEQFMSLVGSQAAGEGHGVIRMPLGCLLL